MNGIIKYKTARVTLNNSYTGTPAEHDAAHDHALFNIPSYSFIKKVWVKVITLSANASAEFYIAKSATLDTDSGVATNADRVEILGYNVNETHWWKTSSDSQSNTGDIIASNSSNSGVAGAVHMSIAKEIDASQGWIGDANSGAGWGIYVVHAKANTATDGGADAVLDIGVEYY